MKNIIKLIIELPKNDIDIDSKKCIEICNKYPLKLKYQDDNIKILNTIHDKIDASEVMKWIIIEICRYTPLNYKLFYNHEEHYWEDLDMFYNREIINILNLSFKNTDKKCLIMIV